MNDKSIEMYRDILRIIENRSTCIRLKVAALLIKEDRIISSGWKGVPSKHEHCSEVFKNSSPEDIKLNHALFSKNNELHAEQNCISYAAKNGISTKDSIMFVSISPCTECAKLIIASGIKTVYFIEEYDRGTEGSDLLKKSGINIIKI